MRPIFQVPKIFGYAETNGQTVRPTDGSARIEMETRNWKGFLRSTIGVSGNGVSAEGKVAAVGRKMVENARPTVTSNKLAPV